MTHKLIPLMIVLIFGFAGQAYAHVTVHPKKAPAGSYAKLVFRVPHGCAGSATTGLIVSIPKGVLAVKPQVHTGWTITTKTKKFDKPVRLHGKDIAQGVSEVTWTGGPLDDAYMDEFGLSVKLPNQPGEKLVFPVIQICQKGRSEWTSTKSSAHHADTGKGLPAPIVTLEKSAGHMHM